jgi:hypothetical protein
LPTLPTGQDYSPNTIAFAQQHGPSIGAPQQTTIRSQAPPVTPNLLSALLANPAVGKRGVYRV